MPDPIRLISEWPGRRGIRRLTMAATTQIVREDPVQQAIRIIAKHELRVWFEPRWTDARRLAARFPHCIIFSIPTESDTINLRRVPGWRPRPNRGVV